MSSQRKPGAGRPASSWMVRCWEEPREKAGEEPVFRCFVRDLRTGEERYLSDPRELGELILRKLREAGRTASRDHKSHQKIG
jgi:hypothetical protein